MPLIVTPTTDGKGKITSPVSEYKPDQRTRDRITQLIPDFSIADEIHVKPFTEFNNRPVTQVIDECQKTFNNFIEEPSQDPQESWKANVKRPLTRNKVISIAAHITAAMIYPNVVAQNDRAEEDKAAAIIMKDLMEWSFDQSGYERTFVYAVISALVNPAVIIREGYAEVRRKIKDIVSKDKWEWKEVVDELWSGFYNHIIPVDELYIADPYEHDINKQPFVIIRRIIDFSTAQAKYGNNENFKHVQPGLKVFLNGESGQFYEQYDSELEHRLVEEVVYMNRTADLELTVLNGVMMCDPDNPLQRADKTYGLSVSGYELIDEGRFFYYRSLVDKMRDDQGVLDTLYNMIIDGTFLSIMPPMLVFGDEQYSSAVVVPGAASHMSKDASVTPLNIGSNLSAGMNTLQKIEMSMSESSQDPRQAGQNQGATQTATDVQLLEQNARTILGLFGKMVKFLIEDFGELRKNTILQYMTVAEVGKIIGDGEQLSYKNILIPDRTINGKKKSRSVKFELLPVMTKEEQMNKSFDLMEAEKEKGEDVALAVVDPEVFRENKYLVRVEAEAMQSNSEVVKRQLNLEAYDRAIRNPLANLEAVSRDFLFDTYRPGEADKYIIKKTMGVPGIGQEVAGNPALGGNPQLTGAAAVPGDARAALGMT